MYSVSKGIKVTTVCPSSVNTEIFRKSIVGKTTQDDDRDITDFLALFRKGALSPERYVSYVYVYGKVTEDVLTGYD